MPKPITMRHGRAVLEFPLTPSSDGIGFSVPPHLSGALEAYRSLRAVSDASAAKRAEIKRDPNLSPTGQKNAMRDWASADGARALKAAAVALMGLDGQVAERRSKMTAATFDKTDVAGALLRWQARIELKAMEPARRAALLSTGELDPIYSLAAMEAPPEMSGVTKTQHERLQQRAILAAHPGEARVITEIERAGEALATAMRAAKLDLREATGLGGREIDQLAGEVGLSERIKRLLDVDAHILPDPAEREAA